MEQAKDAVSGATEKVQDWASGAAVTAKDWASGVASGTETAYAATRDTLGGAEESVEAFVRRYPLPAVLSALAVGCLLGCAMSRRF
jgi:hypothetical protein